MYRLYSLKGINIPRRFLIRACFKNKQAMLKYYALLEIAFVS